MSIFLVQYFAIKSSGNLPTFLSHYKMTLQNCSHLSLTFLTDGAQFKTLVTVSVTRLGDLLDFGRLFKAFGSN